MKQLPLMRTFFTFFLHFLSATTICIISVTILFAEETPKPLVIEKELADADNLQRSGKKTESLEVYSSLFRSNELPVELQSLVLLRIAETQNSLGKTDDCRETLRKMNSLEFLPEHHKMYAAEMAAGLDGKPERAYGRTPLPSHLQGARSLYVKQSKGVNDADGSRKKPYPSIMSALKQVRQLRNSGTLPSGAIEILLLDREYSVTETIVLEREDSGSARNPLVLRSANPMSRTLLSGGCTLNSWRVEKDPAILNRLPESSRGRVLTASLQEHNVPNTGELTFGGFFQPAVGRR